MEAEECGMWGEAERSEPGQFLEKKQQEISIAVYNYLIRGPRDDGARLVSKVHSSRMRGNVHKLEHRKF